MTSTLIRLIAAIDSKNGIAKDGHQPWQIPEDLKRFSKLTRNYGGSILMGYNAYHEIGHLDGRTNYVLTRTHLNEQGGDVTFVSDLEKFLTNFNQDLWVIGGEQVYKQTIAKASELYLTKIDHDFGCDQFFPNYKRDFRLLSNEGHKKYGDLNFSYLLLKK